MQAKTHFKILILLLVLPTFVLANNGSTKKKTTREKTITKTYDVNANATLKIESQFGNVDIITWDKNTIEFDIVIKVSGNNEEKVEEKLDGIDVSFSASSNLVSAKTSISKNKKNWWSWGKKMSLKPEINYVIKIPVTNNIDISNDYGNVTVDFLRGRAEINCDFGKITTKELMGKNNELNFDYTKGCYFEYIESGSINADFSSFTLAKTKEIKLNADYTKSNIEIAETINYNCDFKNLTVGKVNSITGNGDYLTLRLGDVYKNASIKSEFGSFKIERFSPKATNLDVESEYTGITIGYTEDSNFDFEIDLEFASLRNAEDFNIIKQRIESSEKYYLGHYGKVNSGSKITINSEFGSVNFKKQ